MNITKLLSVLVAIFFLVGNIFGQSGKYYLKVLDKDTKEPLIDANIKVSNQLFFTSLNGQAIFDLEEQNINATISYIGYEELSVSLKCCEIDQTIYLKLKPSLLDLATITSRKHEIKLAETTTSLDILRSELINDNNVVTVKDALGKVPGVQMVGTQVNIRGGSGFSYGAGSRVMLLIDDMPALSMDAGFPFWNDIPLENIDQIEILKGASSSLYGSSALNGIVNVRTGDPSIEPTTKVSLAYVSFLSPKSKDSKWWTSAPNSVYLGILDKRKLGKFDLVINGSYYNLDSYNQDAYQKRGRISIKTRYRINDRLSVSLNTTYNNASTKDFFLWKSEIDTYAPLEGATSISNVNRLHIDPSLQYFSKAGYKHYFKNRIAYINNGDDGNQSNSSISLYSEYQLHKKLQKIGLNMVFGAVFGSVRSESDLYEGRSLNYTNLATFIQLDKKFFNRLNFVAGTRMEYNKLTATKGESINPLDGSKLVSRLGLNLQLFEATYIRTNWGEGYRFPTIAERYTRTNISDLTIFPNPNLKPETGWTSEFGIKQGLKFGNWDGYIDVSGFYQAYEQMMEFVYYIDDELNFGFQSQNIGSTIIKGYEISLASRSVVLGIPINILAGYTYIDPKYKFFKESNKQTSTVDYNILKYRSKHNLKLDLDATFNALNIGFSLQSTSQIAAIDKVLADFAGIQNFRDSHKNMVHLFDARISYTFSKIELSLQFKNLLNHAYTLRPGLMEAPRNIGLKISCDL